MTAIPKALALANPTHVAACVATAAGLILSKFAIDEFVDEAGRELDDDEIDEMGSVKPKPSVKTLTDEER